MTEYYNSKGLYKTRHSPPSNKKTKECQLWENIRNRCEYLPFKDETRFGKYAGIDSCPEWKDFQNFAKWFFSVKELGYFHEGWQLDKDLLLKGNKIYSPQTCVFLPEDINKSLNTKSRTRGELPMGLSYAKDRKGIQVCFDCKNPSFYHRSWLSASEENIQKGFNVYKNKRESYIQYLAELHKGQLDPRAYLALKAYEVNIDD